MDRKRQTSLWKIAARHSRVGLGNSPTSPAAAETSPGKRVYQQGPKPEKTPLYSPAVSYGNLLFLAGKVARIRGRYQSPHRICAE